MKQNNLVVVTYELMKEILDLPEGVEIEQVLSEDQDRSKKSVRLLVKGDKCHKIPEGCPLMIVSVDELKEMYNTK